MSEISKEVEWERLGLALGVADSELEKIKESGGEDKDMCKKELFKVGIMRGLYILNVCVQLDWCCVHTNCVTLLSFIVGMSSINVYTCGYMGLIM